SGWQVDRVESAGEEADWTAIGGAFRRLQIEPKSSGRDLDIVVRLKRLGPRRPGEQIVFPDLFPEGCAGRTGTLTIRVDPGLDVVASDPIPETQAKRVTGAAAERARTLLSDPISGR